MNRLDNYFLKPFFLRHMILALDIGGTSTRVAVYADSEAASAERYEEFATINIYKEFLARVLQARRSLHGNLNAAGISFGVAFTPDGRAIQATGKLPDYAGRPLVSDMESLLECRCRAAHDCVCGALAERSVSKDSPSLAYVTFSTGTGAAVCMRADPDLVAFRVRIAHHVVDRNGEVCVCGQRGCLAVLTDGLRLTRQAGRPLQGVTNAAFWQPVVDAFAVGLVNLSWMFPIEKIVVGGSIALKNTFVRTMLPPAFAKQRSTGAHRDCAVAFATLGESAPLLGARLLPVLGNLAIIY